MRATTTQSTAIGTLTNTKNGLEARQTGWETALSIALAVTAIAALAVFLFDLQVRRYSKRIQEVQGEIIREKDSELQLSLREKDIKIGEANKAAGEAHQRAGEANERAAKADERAAEANLQLAKLKTPRSISVEQRRQMVTRLSPFAGTEYDLSVSTDPESLDFMDIVDGILRESGWKFVKVSNPVKVGDRAGVIMASGVRIEIYLGDAEKLVAPTEALRAALINAGIPTTANAHRNKDPNDNGAIHLLIGSKQMK